MDKVSQIVVLDNLSIYCYDYKTITTSVPIDIELGKTLKKSKNPISTFTEFLKTTDGCNIYTDSSKFDDSRTGLACICPQLNLFVKKTISSNASVYTSECIALDLALDIALSTSNKNVHIFTDSLSVLEALKSIKISAKTNPFILNIKKKYNNILERNSSESTINLHWVPSHVGIPGNEEADSLAKAATQSDNIDISVVPFSDLYEHFKKDMHSEFVHFVRGKAAHTGKTYFNLYYDDRKKPWFSEKNLSREFIVTLNRSRSDHYNLAASLSRIGIVNDAKCKCQCGDETLNHVIWQCELYDAQRNKLISALRKLKHFPLYNIESFIEKPDISACKYIFDFLKYCNLKI